MMQSLKIGVKQDEIPSAHTLNRLVTNVKNYVESIKGSIRVEVDKCI
jgi:hypothetical protein